MKKRVCLGIFIYSSWTFRTQDFIRTAQNYWHDCCNSALNGNLHSSVPKITAIVYSACHAHQTCPNLGTSVESHEALGFWISPILPLFRLAMVQIINENSIFTTLLQTGLAGLPNAHCCSQNHLPYVLLPSFRGSPPTLLLLCPNPLKTQQEAGSAQV